jgi:hypothetical protein
MKFHGEVKQLTSDEKAEIQAMPSIAGQCGVLARKYNVRNDRIRRLWLKAHPEYIKCDCGRLGWIQSNSVVVCKVCYDIQRRADAEEGLRHFGKQTRYHPDAKYAEVYSVSPAAHFKP